MWDTLMNMSHFAFGSMAHGESPLMGRSVGMNKLLPKIVQCFVAVMVHCLVISDPVIGYSKL